MDYAISMKLGGERVYADKCDFHSYNDLKLRCPVCGEPVYLKQGEYRKPHFAHIHATNARQVEQCELRVSSFGNSTAISNFIKDRGQRLEIFQKSFLSMIAIGKEKIVDDGKFNNWIRAVKSYNNQTMDSITNACTRYFLTHHKQLEATYNLTILHKEVKDARTLLQQQIALEAIDYLCVKSSLNLLEYLLHYSIYKLYEHEQDKLFRQKIGRKDIDVICQFTAKVIVSTSWVEQFNSVININRDVANVQLPIINNQLEEMHHEDEQHHLGNDKLSADQQDELHDKKKNIKTLLSTVRKHTRRLNPDMLDSVLVEISSAITEYLVQNNVSRSDIVGMMQKLTYDNYIKLRDKAIIHHNGKDSSQLRHLPQLENSLISEEIAIHSIDSYVANNSDESIKIAEYKAKKACQLARSVIRLYDEHLSIAENRRPLNESEVGRLALDMTKYCFTTLELNKHDHLAMFQEFKVNLNNWLKNADAIKDSDKRTRWMQDNYQSLPFIQFRDTVLGQNDSWVALSQKVTSEETELIAIHSLKYCDCVLMFKSYQLEINQYGMLSHPEWLDSTLSKWGIQRDNIIGYIGIRHPNSKIEQIGIVHKKQVKNKADKSTKTVLWYTELERYQHKQVNVYKDTQQMEYQVKDRLVFDGHILKKTQVLVTVSKTVLISDVQSTKIEVDPEIACFLSLYGIAHNTGIKPSKLVTINDTSKHINVNW
ncbi:competence protein CoiA family protein [Scytonema sp. NUACC26]|uniref:competence protein CoiA family protein n=1 Tax=Scytonema sp. NUACC26 TaxID=3140176 RepID=UPI0034DC319E